jgi:DNA excision repair protein ERCC-4
MRVQIDSREQTRIKSATEYYKQQGLDVEVCELEVGDYIFDGKVVFEMKLISDFVSSIQNGKIFNQAISQAELFDYHYVIIQGDEASRAKALAMSRNYHEVTYFQYLGAIASLNRYTTVIESYSPFINEAYYRMMITAKKCLQDKPIVKKFPRKDKNTAFNFLCHDVYGINWKKAKNIVDTLNLHTKKDLDTLTKEKLTSVDGIADKTAEKILKAIGE